MTKHLTPKERIEARLDELEQALKREPDKEYRRELVKEYLELSEPHPEELEL